MNADAADATGLKKELKASQKQSASQSNELLGLRQHLARVTASKDTAEQQLQSKAEKLKQHQDVVAQQDSDSIQLRQELTQSIAACKQLHADSAVATEREAALQAHAGRQQDQLANAQDPLAGEMRVHTLYFFCALLVCCCQ